MEIIWEAKMEWFHEGRIEEKPKGKNKEETEIERTRTNWEQKSAIHNSEIRVSRVLFDPEDHLVSIIIVVKYIMVNFSALLWYG